jgi:hypothetical protein
MSDWAVSVASAIPPAGQACMAWQEVVGSISRDELLTKMFVRVSICERSGCCSVLAR